MLSPFLALAFLIQATRPDGGVVVVKGQTFLAEVASTPAEQAKGLMHRAYLEKNRCMFFLYEGAEDLPHTIWMKNCLIPLDVVWVKADGTVVEIAENVPPPSPMRVYASDTDYPTYGGRVLSRSFVEFPQGTVRRLKLKVGERIGWDLEFQNGRRARGGLLPAGRKGKRGEEPALSGN